ncbi:protein RALF-like 1 [Carica papaya]|uniref:protein RALF-like 1 n=1 Tax=Carica papaya TaxID=3649 RepID=UPI000B8CF6ED|nr:protein RALF-like 1 [Carica papaya]
MSKSFTSTLLIINVSLAAMITIISIRTVDGGGGDNRLSSWEVLGKDSCRGSMAECVNGEDEELELMMNREIKRRVLATSQYISYDSLQRNSVPCSQRGASYYNCQQGAQANPYTRGCTAITRCRSS